LRNVGWVNEEDDTLLLATQLEAEKLYQDQASESNPESSPCVTDVIQTDPSVSSALPILPNTITGRRGTIEDEDGVAQVPVPRQGMTRAQRIIARMKQRPEVVIQDKPLFSGMVQRIMCFLFQKAKASNDP
jgi:hypothetical protein